MLAIGTCPAAMETRLPGNGQLRDACAVPADVGQRDVTWEVLADPEGNEFCVLTPR